MLRILCPLLLCVMCANPAWALFAPDAGDATPVGTDSKGGAPSEGISVNLALSAASAKEGDILDATLTYTNHTDAPLFVFTGMQAIGYWPIFEIMTTGLGIDSRPLASKLTFSMHGVGKEVPAKGSIEIKFKVRVRIVDPAAELPAANPSDSGFDVEWFFRRTGEHVFSVRTTEFTPERRMLLSISGNKAAGTRDWNGLATSKDVKITIKGN
jgi:hypothetical protein